MEPSFSIDIKDQYRLLCVWEFHGSYWRLVTLARPKQAKAMCQNQGNMLVFPSYVNPNSIDKQHCLRAAKSRMHRINYGKKILQLLQDHPGQSASLISEQLDIKVGAVRQHLLQLANERKIYYRRCAEYRKTRLYYPKSDSISFVKAFPNQLRDQADTHQKCIRA